MFRNTARRTVGFRNSMDPFAENMTKYYPGYTVVFTFVSAYTLGSFLILRNQLSPIERIMTEMKQESKQSFDKLEMNTKERIDKLEMNTKEGIDTLEMITKQSFDKLEINTKERIDKLEMKLDGISKEIKDSNDKINTRVDSVLLRSLDLQRVPKPAASE